MASYNNENGIMHDVSTTSSCSYIHNQISTKVCLYPYRSLKVCATTKLCAMKRPSAFSYLIDPASLVILVLLYYVAISLACSLLYYHLVSIQCIICDRKISLRSVWETSISYYAMTHISLLAPKKWHPDFANYVMGCHASKLNPSIEALIFHINTFYQKHI